jgi:hypothetical protein
MDLILFVDQFDVRLWKYITAVKLRLSYRHNRWLLSWISMTWVLKAILSQSLTSLQISWMKPVSQPISENGGFKYDDNNISFSYTVPEYNKYINVEYQYLLEGSRRNGVNG